MLASTSIKHQGRLPFNACRLAEPHTIGKRHVDAIDRIVAGNRELARGPCADSR